MLFRSKLQEECTLRYAGGKLVEKTTVVGAQTRSERWSYADGRLQEYQLFVDGEVKRRETSTWKDGLLESTRVEEDGTVQISRWTYDALGRTILMEKRSESGELIGRTEYGRSMPTVPIHFALSLGGG